MFEVLVGICTALGAVVLFCALVVAALYTFGFVIFERVDMEEDEAGVKRG